MTMYGRTYGRGHAHQRQSMGPHWGTWVVVLAVAAIVILVARERGGPVGNLGKYAGKPGHAPKVGHRAGRGGHR